MNLLPIPPGMETEAFAMNPGALNDVPELVRRHFQARRPWIVADENTWRAAGEKLFAVLKSAGLDPFDPFIFPAVPMLHADDAITPRLTEAMPFDCVPVSVGGGTINDLVKRASAVTRHRYLCVPTASSVDGYTSYGAAMTDNGLKKTLPCLAPLAVAADTDVLKAAPPPMAASGYADLAAKVAGGADWVIADELGIEPIRADVWDLVQKDLRKWISDPADIGAIFLGLAATGYSMQMYRESRPASGAEHMISHLWEMENLEFKGVPVSHGFKVGIGTLASTRTLELLLEQDWAHLDVDAVVAQWWPSFDDVKATFPSLFGDRPAHIRRAELEYAKKFPSRDTLRAELTALQAKWPELSARIRAQLLPFEEVRANLKKAGAPVEPEQIGVTRARFRETLRGVPYMRSRYFGLDLVLELGLMDALTDRLFGKQGIWAV